MHAQAQEEQARLNSIGKQKLSDHNQQIAEQVAMEQQRNSEFDIEIKQMKIKQQLDLDAARIEAELSIKKKEELLLIEHNQREEELQKNLDLLQFKIKGRKSAKRSKTYKSHSR